MSLGSDLDLPVVLRRLTRTAADLVGARYGALGVLSADRTHLSSFVTVGLTDDESQEIGELPKGHGILGLLIVDPRPLRLHDLRQHPESFGFPPNHPPMQSFLGVPVLVRGEAFGNLYLTDKIDGEALVRALLAYKRGEPRVCAMLRVPTPEEEDRRRLVRERKALTNERVRHVKRVKGLPFGQGVSGYQPLNRGRRKRLEELRCGSCAERSIGTARQRRSRST